MSESSSNNSGSIIVGLLGVAFVVLKLTNMIAWSWWWVTAPFWMPVLAVLFVAAVILIFSNSKWD